MWVTHWCYGEDDKSSLLARLSWKLYCWIISGLESMKKLNVIPNQEKQVLHSKDENNLPPAMLHCQVHRGCDHEPSKAEENADLGRCPRGHDSSAWHTGIQGSAPCFNIPLHHNTHYQQPHHASGMCNCCYVFFQELHHKITSVFFCSYHHQT